MTFFMWLTVGLMCTPGITWPTRRRTALATPQVSLLRITSWQTEAEHVMNDFYTRNYHWIPVLIWTPKSSNMRADSGWVGDPHSIAWACCWQVCLPHPEKKGDLEVHDPAQKMAGCIRIRKECLLKPIIVGFPQLLQTACDGQGYCPDHSDAMFCPHRPTQVGSFGHFVI